MESKELKELCYKRIDFTQIVPDNPDGILNRIKNREHNECTLTHIYLYFCNALIEFLNKSYLPTSLALALLCALSHELRTG